MILQESDNTVDITLGNTLINEVYLGNDLIWERNSEFVEVEYLENISNSYIDTGQTATKNMKIDIVVSFSSLGRSNFIIGKRNRNNAINTRSNYMAGIFVDSNNNFGIGYNRSDTRLTDLEVQENIKYHLTNTFNSLNIEDENQELYNLTNGGAYGTYIGTNSMFLFNIRQPNISANNSLLGKIYSCKLYNSSNVLLRDFVPGKMNGKYGMMDMVNNVFYTSPNSTPFRGGPIVQNSND